jgi:hypothetical protein
MLAAPPGAFSSLKSALAKKAIPVRNPSLSFMGGDGKNTKVENY